MWPCSPAEGGRDACWCQRFCQHDSPDNQAALEAELAASSVPIGLVAYLDDRPAGWTRVVPRYTLPGVAVGVALLRAAVEFARSQGAAVLDGHPVDIAPLRARPSPSAVFTGTKAMFDAAGFVELGRTYVSRPVMRKTLTPTDGVRLRW
jgi:hypothetical protein